MQKFCHWKQFSTWRRSFNKSLIFHLIHKYKHHCLLHWNRMTPEWLQSGYLLFLLICPLVTGLFVHNSTIPAMTTNKISVSCSQRLQLFWANDAMKNGWNKRRIAAIVSTQTGQLWCISFSWSDKGAHIYNANSSKKDLVPSCFEKGPHCRSSCNKKLLSLSDTVCTVLHIPATFQQIQLCLP